jgi:putative ABC transport system permease protein
LSEAIVMSLIGGALGVLAGILGSLLLQNTLHWEMQLSAQIMAIAGLFSAAVGPSLAITPVGKAARLDRIEGLPYE